MLIRAFGLGEGPEFSRRMEQLAGLPDLSLMGSSALRDALGRVANEPVDLIVVQDTESPDTLLRTVRSLRNLPEHPDVVVIASQEDPRLRAELLTVGCTAVVYAGLAEEVILGTLAAIVARRRHERDEPRVSRLPDGSVLEDFVSSSPAMQRLIATAKRVAESDASLLILGETGAGKERLARAIHASGPRKTGPFIAINCGAIPEALLESELFGHERGAFTGALRARRGHFELAHHGTLFLDEVGELPAHLQVKFLRALQDHRIQPVGAERVIETDVRVIAATSRNLQRAIEEKRFREDLYYRLSVITLTLPPLRERKEDIPLLADSFRARFAARLNRSVRRISADALEILASYPWPGNVRELANVMERAVLLSSGEVIEADDVSDLARPMHGEAGKVQELEALFGPAWAELPWHQARQEALSVFEKLYLTRVLQATQGRLGEAAKRSGLNPRSLYEKMQRHGLSKDMFRPSEGGVPAIGARQRNNGPAR